MRFARLKTHDYRGEGYYFIIFGTAPRRENCMLNNRWAQAIASTWPRAPDSY